MTSKVTSQPPTHSHQSMRERSSRSNATRYICAAGYLDPGFCEAVIDETLNQRHRAVAPSYDVDLTPILHHCVAAHRQRMWVDAAVSVILLLILLLFPLTLAFPMAACYLAYAVLSSPLWRGELTTRMSKSRPASLLLVVAVVIALWWLTSSFTSRSSYPTYDSYGQRVDGFRLPSMGGSPFWLGLVLLLGLWGVLWYAHVRTHRLIVEQFQPAAFANAPMPLVSPQVAERIDYIGVAQRGNLTLYSEQAVHRPFVGSGDVFRAWSMALPLKPDDSHGQDAGQPPPELTRRSLHDRLRLALANLNRPDAPESERLNNLSVQDRIYVAGRLAPQSQFLDQSTMMPMHRVDPGTVRATSDKPRGAQRHYQVVRVSSWEGELETSMFVYANVRGGMFYLEVVGTRIAPIRRRYHAIDAYERLSARVMADLARKAFKDIIREAPVSPLRLLRAVSHSWHLRKFERDERRAISDRLSFDYGAQVSVRELASRSELGYFEISDVEEIFRVVSRRLVGAIGEIFRDFGYDCSEFEARANVVINNSTSITGSVVSQSSFATGNAASASSQPPTAGNPKL